MLPRPPLAETDTIGQVFAWLVTVLGTGGGGLVLLRYAWKWWKKRQADTLAGRERELDARAHRLAAQLSAQRIDAERELGNDEFLWRAARQEIAENREQIRQLREDHAEAERIRRDENAKCTRALEESSRNVVRLEIERERDRAKLEALEQHLREREEVASRRIEELSRSVQALTDQLFELGRELERAQARGVFDRESVDRLVIEEAGDARLAGRRLLVVEDDPDSNDMLAFAFGRSGAAATTAKTAAEGLALFTAGTYDCLVLDIGLPDADGCTLLRRIRDSERRRHAGHTPAIALTAYDRREDVVRARAAGFERLASKPANFELLVAMVEALVAPSTSSIPQARGLRGRRILIVDDDPRVSAVLRDALAAAGAEARCVASTKGADAALIDFAAELLILDLVMPEESGSELLRRLRARGLTVPAIGFTGFLAAQSDAWQTAGFAAVLEKPFVAPVIAEAIRLLNEPA